MEEVYKGIISWYGKKAQTIKACEELSELLDVLCKGLNKPMNTDALTEEIADVQVMIEQLKLIYGIGEVELARIRKEKIERTQKRMVEDVNWKVMKNKEG